MGSGHERNSLVYWVSWRMEQRSTVRVAVPSSSSGQAGARAATARDDGLEGGGGALAVGLAQGHEADGGGDEVGGEGLEVGRQEQGQGHAVAGGDGGHGQRVGQAGAVGEQGRQAAGRVGPAREAGAGEGLALGAGLQRQLGGGGQGLGQGAQLEPGGQVAGGDGGMGVGQQHGVDPAAAVAQHGVEPGLQPGAVAHEALLDRPFQAVAVAVGADRVGGREPGEQAVEGGVSAHGRRGRRRRPRGRTGRWRG